jgi:biotin synthase-related radical SAM superfamily protein
MPIEKIRVSIGSASVLGLSFNTFKVPPTNCYLMTFKQGHCIANCGFCPQSRESDSSTEKLSRINWPVYSFKEFLTKLKYLPPSKKFERICIQTLNYPENFRDLREIIVQIKKVSNIPISIAIPPMSKGKLKELKAMGVQRVGIALDGATAEVFEKIKGEGVDGPYSWKTHFQSLKEALEIFPDRFVTTHIIIGLGETEKEILSLIFNLKTLKINVSLFAFTPIKGTKFENMEQPEIINFRKMQIGRHLILYENKILEDFVFNREGNLVNININRKDLENIINSTSAFLTSGCPGCNRPFYTSRPSGPIFNYPRELNDHEKEEIYNLLVNYVN